MNRCPEDDGAEGDSVRGRLRRAWTWVVVGVGGLLLASIIWFSLRSASWRVYHPDEFGKIAVASLVAIGKDLSQVGQVQLLHLVLSPFAGTESRSVDNLAAARFLFLEIAWVNLILVALAARVRLFSPQGVLAVCLAASLAPFWEWAIEVRSDNLLLTGLLLTWCAVRTRPLRMQSVFLAGFAAVVLEFLVLEALVFSLPLSIAVLVFPPPGLALPRWKLALIWGAGALVALVTVFITFLAAGAGFPSLPPWEPPSEVPGDRGFLSVFRVLASWLTQAPLLLAFLSAAVAAFIIEMRRKGGAALNWDGLAPEALFFIWAIGVAVLDLSPNPHHFLVIVCSGFLLGFRYALDLFGALRSNANQILVLVGLILFAHLTPFLLAARRQLSWPNTRQEELMRLAESLTAPGRDPVYDGLGMVSSRPLLSRPWLHVPSGSRYPAAKTHGIRETLIAQPAPVLIASHRMDFLPREDHAFIAERYVSLADDFLVLGNVLPPGGGAFLVVRPGRYRISSLETSDLAGTHPGGILNFFCPERNEVPLGALDGNPLTDHPVELAAGWHWIECETACQAAVVWVGPRAERPHRLGQMDRHLLLRDWRWR